MLRDERSKTCGLLRCLPSLFRSAERVAQRDSEARGVAAAELEVVADEIKPGFRPEEDVVEDVQLQPSAHIAGQVIDAGKVGAGKEAASECLLVKADALTANSTHQFGSRVLSQRRGKDRVEVVEDWTEGQESLREVSLRPPMHFTTYPEVLQKKKITAEANESSAAD